MQNVEASKIVFILVGLTACVMAYFGKLDQDNFMILASSAFSAYFVMPSNKRKSDNDDDSGLAGVSSK